MRVRTLSVCCAMAVAAMGGWTAAFPAAAQTTAVTGKTAPDAAIAAMPLEEALAQFTAQTGIKFAYASNVVAGRRSHDVPPGLAPEEKLRRLLEGTGLRYRYLSANTVTLMADGDGDNGAVDGGSRQSRKQVSSRDEDIVGMPAIMVQGARTLNMDITRTRDDPQPYVVFDRDLIERSGATSVEQLLQQRLPMNTSVASMGGAVSMSDYRPGTSGINLRGLGSGQTLILVDGHRMSSPLIDGATSQGEISGIPLAAVERIEILPSTASGIYGGSATGGVINIITRKDYSGGEVRLTYDNTFSTDSAVRNIDFVFGHNFNQGRTNILLSAGYSDANTLTEADRGFVSRGYAHKRHHNPDYYLDGVWNTPASRRPNFFSVDGSDLVLKSGVALGSPYGTVPVGYGGVATDGGAALAATAGQHDWSLPDGVGGLSRELYTEPRVKNAGVVLRHRFNDGLQVFVDLSTSETQRRHSEILPGGIRFTLPVDSPYNPFTTAIDGRVSIPFHSSNWSRTERDRAVVGVVKQLSADWQMSLDYTWDRTRLEFLVAPQVFRLLSGVSDMDILRDPDAFPFSIDGPLDNAVDAISQTTMKNTSLRFSGPLGHLPGGRPVLSTALAYRAESAPDAWRDEPMWDQIALIPARSTSVSSAYMEYRVPLFSEQNARLGFRELELQVAARYEKYISRAGGTFTWFPREGVPSPLPEMIGARNEFSSVDPTIALRWKPIEDLALRVSYGTGFQPPSLDQLVPRLYPHNGIDLFDPRRGNSSLGVITVVSTGNPNLMPESSKSWSAGLVFTPSYLPGLRMSVDYTRMEKSDNIGEIPSWQQGVIDREALFPERVVRGPNLPGDPSGWAGPIIQIDSSPANLSSLELEAWDVQLDYRWDTEARGAFDFFLVGTWQPRYAIQLISGAPVVDYVGLGAVNPLEFKGNAGLTWNLSAWRAGWNLNYFDSYRAAPPEQWHTDMAMANQGNGGRVPSQIYHDVFVNYDFALSNANGIPGWLSGTQVQLGIRNLFNKRPPVDMGAEYSHAYYSPFGSPRMASYYLAVTTRF